MSFIFENWETIDALLTLILGWAGATINEKRKRKKYND